MITNIDIVKNESNIEVLSLAKAKKQLRLESDFTDEDELIQDYIHAAVEAAEQYIGSHIYTKTMTVKLSAMDSSVTFEAFPFRSVASVNYYLDDVLTAIDVSDYYTSSLNKKQTKLFFKDPPSKVDERHDAVTIVLNIGYAAATDVPKPIIQAIKLMVSDMYERREDRPETITTAAQSLMRPFRKYT